MLSPLCRPTSRVRVCRRMGGNAVVVVASSHGVSRVRVCRRTGRDGVSSQLSSQGEGGRTVVVASSHEVGEGEGEGEGAPSLSCRRTRWVRVRARATSGDRHALSFH